MRLLSPRELADALGVSESSLKRWVDSGRLVAARTEGGHRRISLPEAVRFIRETGAPVARPELLDLPEVAIAQTRALSSNTLLHYLLDGDHVAARGWMMARYLAGQAIADICDGAISEAMHHIGELWRHDGDGIFIEHRATDTCLQAINYVRTLFEPNVEALVAVGAAPEHDPYILGSLIAATVIASSGLRAINLGANTPLSALDHAIARHQPRLVWLSVSSPIAPAKAREIARWCDAQPPTILVAIGGRQSAAIAVSSPNTRMVGSMTELARVATELRAQRSL